MTEIVTIEKQVWESTLHRSMVLQAENDTLKDKIERLEKRYDRAKWWLNEIVNNHRFTPISTAEKALKDLSELEK